jgi:hypothetical protein
MNLQHGDSVPHFTGVIVSGASVAYTDIWQRYNLLFVCLAGQDGPLTAGTEAYVAGLRERLEPAIEPDTRLVITTDSVPGLPSPGVALADAWGELHLVAAADSVADLPSPDDIAQWLEYVRSRCPECEGEAR